MADEKNPKKGQESCLYFDISTQERDSAIRYLLTAILKVREEKGFPSNQHVYDEDVNIYLAHLLFAVALPEYHEMSAPYLSQESSEILDWVRATEDKTIRYFIFKVNADHLLIHSAIFDDLAPKHGRKFFHRSPRYFQELSKLYYDQAAGYHKRIYRKSTGVGEVLEKISKYLPFYQALLKHVRRDYFHFASGFRDKAFQQFLDELKNYEQRFTRQSRTDLFLDLYGAWIKKPDTRLRQQLLDAARELEALDPTFHFDPDTARAERRKEA